MECVYYFSASNELAQNSASRSCFSKVQESGAVVSNHTWPEQRNTCTETFFPVRLPSYPAVFRFYRFGANGGIHPTFCAGPPGHPVPKIRHVRALWQKTPTAGAEQENQSIFCRFPYKFEAYSIYNGMTFVLLLTDFYQPKRFRLKDSGLISP